MESSADFSEAAQSCLQLYAPSLAWNDITSCAKGELGHKLMYENALTTRALNPAYAHVPWVTFDGEYTVEFQDKAMSSLFSLVCDLYKSLPVLPSASLPDLLPLPSLHSASLPDLPVPLPACLIA